MESSSQSKWLEMAFVQEGVRDLCYQNLAPTEVLLSHSQPRHKNSTTSGELRHCRACPKAAAPRGEELGV